MAMLQIPTVVTSLDRIDFMGSSKNLQITATSEGYLSQFSKAVVRVWVWEGNYLTPFVSGAEPTFTFEKDKVSSTDSYVNFEIGQYVSSMIKPEVSFTVDTMYASHEGVYWQYEVDLYVGDALIFTGLHETRFATLGWNWDYEGEGTFTYNRGAFGFPTFDIDKFYSPFLSYSMPEFNLNAAQTSQDMIKRVPVTVPGNLVRCPDFPYIILYLNKWGMFDTFTPTGSVKINNPIARETYTRTHRNPLNVNTTRDYEKTQLSVIARQQYLINTGFLYEEMGQLVEEILYSPQVYLVEFLGDISTEDTIPITADNTFITADNTIVTVDSAQGVSGRYITFRQYPAIILDNDFIRKTRIVDKNKLSYNLRLELSRDKIN